jgi:hypothetical protein
VRTLTTSGPDGTLSGGSARLLAAVESLVGIYFLSIIIAGSICRFRRGSNRMNDKQRGDANERRPWMATVQERPRLRQQFEGLGVPS